MQAVIIDADELRQLAADRGIDTVAQLAKLTNVSSWILYRALKSERIQPSHALAIAKALDAEVEDFKGYK